MKPRIHKFWKIYIIAVSAFLLLLSVFLCFLWSVLADYEKSRPRKVVDEIFSRYIQTGDFESLFEAEKIDFGFEDKNKIADNLRERCKEELSVYRTNTKDETERYVITSGEERVVTIGLEKSGEKSKYGFDFYKLSTFDFDAIDVTTVKVKLPKTYELKINGKTVDASYITEKDIKSESCDYMPKGVTGLLYDEYTVKGLLPNPEITVTSDGKTAILTEKEDGSFFTEPINDASLEAGLSDYVITAAKAYALYLQNDGTLENMAQYFDKSSDLYKRIKSNQMYVLPHNGCYFKNISVSEFYKYDTNIISCRVKMEQVLRSTYNTEYSDFIDITLFMSEKNGTYLIYNMKTHE